MLDVRLMGSFDPYSRRQLRQLRKRWLRRNAVLVTVLAVGMAVLAAVVSAMVLLASPPGAGYLLGLIHAGMIAATLHVVNSAFLAHEREAVLQVRGAWGEENTRTELQRAKRRRLVWGWVDSITLQAGDLDHVVVTRSGGIVVLDSKWRSEVTTGSVAEMTASARRGRVRAEALTRTLLRSDRSARHRAAGKPVDVTAAVVLWGAARHSVPDNHQVDGVHFVGGRDLVRWLRGLDGDPVSREAATDMLQRLKKYRATAFEATRTASRP